MLTGHEPPLTLGPATRALLVGLRWRARASLALRGLGSVALVVVALALLSFALDRPLRLAWSSRAVILVLMLTLLGAAAWSRLLRPLLTPLPDDELARQAEARHAFLDWRLLSAVQFARPGWAPGPETSRVLAALVVDDAERCAGGVDAGRVVPAGPALQAGFRGGVVLAAGLLLVCGFPEAAATWARRNLLLSSVARWPQDTHLVLEAAALDQATGTAVVPHGSELALLVRAEGVVPKRVYVETWGEAQGVEAQEGQARRSELLVLDALGDGRFRVVLDEVTAGFSFVVRGGDAEEGPFRVRVIRRPWVDVLVIRVTPPPHTGLPARAFGVDAGSVTLPAGTRVRLEGRVSKPLAQVALEELPLGADVATLHTATIVDGGFEAGLVLERTAAFRVDVVDRDGLGLAQPLRFSLLAQPDRPPEVQLALVGVGLNVTPQATVRARVGASDDHGVVAARLRLKVGAADAPRDTALPGLAGQRAGEAQAALELDELELSPKTALTLWAEALDADPRGPNVGASPAVQLRVVTPEQLLAELLRRLHEQRLELDRMVLEEERLAQGLAGHDQATLERASRAHRDVGRAVLRAADVVDGVVAEMTSNRLLDAATWDRLTEDVARPLRALQQGPLQEARDLAERAAQADEGGRPAASLAAGAAAAVMASELRAIVARMGRIEELAELVGTLKRLIEKQRELLDRTRQGEPRRR
ncbi:MAG: DUF4175 domain-containing protein [Planctomycetes bacterium]|nr:DUF4175 domain-containing protein [Planctomycetota bacterium]